MRFTTTHTQPSAVKRELIPLRQDLVCASSQHQQTLVERTAQLPRDDGIVCGELRRSDSLSSNHVLLLCKTILKHCLKGFLEGKSLTPKWRKSADKSLWRMQPLQYDLRSPAAKANSITNTATARSNLDASHYNAICRD